MAELLQNAGLGWTSYKECGKLAALLLAALLYLWFVRKEKTPLLLYTSVMTVLCILPVTAVLLMLYQTKFYDYQWIWSAVPLTAVTAYGAVLFLADYGIGSHRAGGRKAVPVIALLLAAALLSGGLGRQVWDRRAGKEEKAQARLVLESLRELCPGEICLWAPREIQEYARELDASIKLPYGRNMWDLALNAYAYDVYGEGTIAMCRWMTWTEETGEADRPAQPAREQESGKQAGEPAVTLEESAGNALAVGVNLVLLPENALPGTVERMERALGTKAQSVEGYYLFHIDGITE